MRRLLVLLLSSAVACGDATDEPTSFDGGFPDSAAGDAGRTPDAGATDAGFADAGFRDGGPRDGGPRDGGFLFEWREHTREIFAPYIERGWVPGVSIVVWRDGQAEYLGLGRVDPAVDAAPQPDTIYEIASITKTFTGTLLALAIERGDVTLDTPLVDLVEAGAQVPTAGNVPITLRHLTTHRAGLVRDAPSALAVPVPGGPQFQPIDGAMLYAELAATALTWVPGTTYQYSSFGVGWLGYEMQRLAGAANYDATLEPQIAGPLGLVDTVTMLSAEQMARAAPALEAPDLATEPTFWGALDGAGGLRSTAADMGRWIGAQIDPPPGMLGDAIRATHVDLATAPNFHVGMNWLLLAWDDTLVHFHGGAASGVALVVVCPEANAGVAIMMNSRIYGEDVLALAVLDEVRGRSWSTRPGVSWPIPRASIEVPPGTFEELEGRYLYGNTPLDLVVQDGQLFARFSTVGTRAYLRVWPHQTDTYHLRRIRAQMVVVRDGNGAVTGVRWLQTADHLYVRQPG